MNYGSSTKITKYIVLFLKIITLYNYFITSKDEFTIAVWIKNCEAGLSSYTF